MGDSDLMPITSYESTILVRILHQIASRTNELVSDLTQFSLYKNVLPKVRDIIMYI